MRLLDEVGAVDRTRAPFLVVAAVERHEVVVEQGQAGLRRAGHGASPDRSECRLRIRDRPIARVEPAL